MKAKGLVIVSFASTDKGEVKKKEGTLSECVALFDFLLQGQPTLSADTTGK